MSDEYYCDFYTRHGPDLREIALEEFIDLFSNNEGILYVNDWVVALEPLRYELKRLPEAEQLNRLEEHWRPSRWNEVIELNNTKRIDDKTFIELEEKLIKQHLKPMRRKLERIQKHKLRGGFRAWAFS